ncbi:MAG: hypothetical protein ABI675_05350 [Chitinophagaceae bacterium]
MKSDVMPSIIQMEYGDLQDLLQEVKETVAKDIKLPEPATKPSFGVVDLWKIRRNAKSAIGMFKG